MKGAFTDAVADRMGRFEAADGGTIFLDEVGDLSPVVQLKMLRVLQEREFERVGGRKTVPVDGRVVAAMHRDLKRPVQEGRFREDLHYRLRVVPISLPPLRERKDDLPLPAAHMVEKFNQEMGRSRGTVGRGDGRSPDHWQSATGYWPLKWFTSQGRPGRCFRYLMSVNGIPAFSVMLRPGFRA